MSSSKKLTCKGTLRQMFICLIPASPPPYTLYAYMYMFTQGGGGAEGRVNQREG